MSKFLAEFGVPKNFPGQMPGYRTVEVFENELYESAFFKKGKWGGEKLLEKRGWAKYTNQTGDRHLPLSSILQGKESETQAPPEANAPPTDEAAAPAEEAEFNDVSAADTSVADVTAEDTHHAAQAKYSGHSVDLLPEELNAEIQKWDAPLPDGCEWVGPWRLNNVYLPTGEEGWIYADSMKQLLEHYKEKISRRRCTRGSAARRRLWYRVMKKSTIDASVPKPFLVPLTMHPFFERNTKNYGSFTLQVYENQRWSPFLMSWGSSFPGHLLFHDPAPLTDESFENKIHDWAVLDACPEGFKWAGDWTVDEQFGKTGLEGFIHGTDFPSFHNGLGHLQIVANAASNVRRRRWTRKMIPKQAFTDFPMDEFPIKAIFPANNLIHPSRAKKHHSKQGLHHIDLVLVHGLTGDAETTWKGPIRLRRSKTLWPEEYLFSEDENISVFGVGAVHGNALTRSVRVLVVEHKLFLNSTEESVTVEGTIKELMRALHDAQVGCRPVIWIGHSIGGLLIKEVLWASARAFKQTIRPSPLVELTRGVVFLGTPHLGSTAANTLVDLRLSKKSPILDYLKPSLHFHELQSWFNDSGIEYLNCIENADVSPSHFGGIIATVVVKVMGLRIVQVNDGIIGMGGEPDPKLRIPIRYNYLCDLDHWGIGTLRMNSPEHEKVYRLIRLSVARWVQEPTGSKKHAWGKLSARITRDICLLGRLLEEIFRDASAVCLTLSALASLGDNAFVLNAMRALMSKSGHQDRLACLKEFAEISNEAANRIHQFVVGPFNLDDLIGNYRIDLEGHLCVVEEKVEDPKEKDREYEGIAWEAVSNIIGAIMQVDSPQVATALANRDVSLWCADQSVLWVEFARAAMDFLPPSGSSSEVEEHFITIAIDELNTLLLKEIAAMDVAVFDQIKDMLMSPETIVASIRSRVSKTSNAPEAPAPPLPEVPPPSLHLYRDEASEDEDGPLPSIPAGPPPLPPNAPPPPLPPVPPPVDFHLNDSAESGDIDDVSDLTDNPPPSIPPPVPPPIPSDSIDYSSAIASEGSIIEDEGQDVDVESDEGYVTPTD
jgi:pimeloyl-ACP methyl ester carboxylesterase